jgi:hypothetical protein
LSAEAVRPACLLVAIPVLMAQIATIIPFAIPFGRFIGNIPVFA